MCVPPLSLETSLLIILPPQRQILRWEVSTLEFISSPTPNLKKPQTTSIHIKNLGTVALALSTMVRAHAQTQYCFHSSFWYKTTNRDLTQY